jgi:hypothetical protein
VFGRGHARRYRPDMLVSAPKSSMMALLPGPLGAR